MDKQKQIIAMFDQIAPTYDSANRVLSLGIDITWRKEACKRAFEYTRERDGLVIADIACGTGDMMIHWDKNAHILGKNINTIIGVDPSKGMLEVAKEKFKNYPDTQKIRWITGEAKDLQAIESKSIDILSIAYGLRNVIDIKEALGEFGRVLKQGGVLVVLEFTKKEKESFLDKITSIYTKKILPFIGGFISKNYQAYQYLPDSIGDFLSLSGLKEALELSGFDVRFAKDYSMGISTLLIGVKR
ncbi:bifunctional demethylmenaquinone methyltransferase/2-methoxy-6-polyprenyl-1,4-benzoquinol methylase [Helicobacter sp. 12S02634-8]|uniref:bifunctional demethylmenaquinone methyltransferase/2-methoxy-6-polyprenyl-1,4-benzoquinol methylase UbiE n=1 Tax=Helicobacter sp. 12S02634-8 TaxID=1476199 RepID=UPI000BA74E82|nr:bifunctional demethylmenaquinone methyltransferase/2-methoxy-6-polyprenyl-1,4-benzoquinol methylase UbiE [Helicobacter sp. 12S02634-8]PAF46212.1 bifunctional demethylmenaquinone methyltransferase/2-methoxy-6-polyprenyl-1,4-benzoquinol methylase [Helicobacter sp. 12S02634-8]